MCLDGVYFSKHENDVVLWVDWMVGVRKVGGKTRGYGHWLLRELKQKDL